LIHLIPNVSEFPYRNEVISKILGVACITDKILLRWYRSRNEKKG